MLVILNRILYYSVHIKFGVFVLEYLLWIAFCFTTIKSKWRTSYTRACMRFPCIPSSLPKLESYLATATVPSHLTFCRPSPHWIPIVFSRTCTYRYVSGYQEEKKRYHNSLIPPRTFPPLQPLSTPHHIHTTHSDTYIYFHMRHITLRAVRWNGPVSSVTATFLNFENYNYIIYYYIITKLRIWIILERIYSIHARDYAHIRDAYMCMWIWYSRVNSFLLPFEICLCACKFLVVVQFVSHCYLCMRNRNE